MFVPLSPLTEKMGESMNSIMNSRRGGGLRKMIRRTDPLIRGAQRCLTLLRLSSNYSNFFPKQKTLCNKISV
jgi:hypothetical protein